MAEDFADAENRAVEQADRMSDADLAKGLKSALDAAQSDQSPGTQGYTRGLLVAAALRFVQHHHPDGQGG